MEITPLCRRQSALLKGTLVQLHMEKSKRLWLKNAELKSWCVYPYSKSCGRALRTVRHAFFLPPLCDGAEAWVSPGGHVFSARHASRPRPRRYHLSHCCQNIIVWLTLHIVPAPPRLHTLCLSLSMSFFIFFMSPSSSTIAQQKSMASPTVVK